MAEPRVRFKRDDRSGYPEWINGRFGDLIEVYDEKVTSDCTLPVLTSSKTDGIQYQSDHFGREQLHDITGYNVIPRGYCTYRNRSDGTDFTFNINNLCDRGIVSKFYPVFHATQRCNLYFLMTLMNNEPKTVRKIAATAKGTGQKVLSFLDLQKIDINIPCLEEQQKIADFLSNVDEVIAACTEKVANLETQKKAVMKKIFSREVRFKRADGSDYPEWEEKKLGEIADIVGGGTPDTSIEDYWVNGDVEWFTPTEVGHEKYVGSSKRKISQLGFTKSSARKLPAGTLLLTSRATIGEMSIAEKECCTNQGFQSLIVHDGVDNEFIYYCQPIIKKYGLKHAAGSTFLEISGTNMGKCPLKIPCLEEQRLIADFFSSFDETIVSVKKELELWKELKKGLLQQMFV